jgi:hypothetical protein
LPQQVDNLPCVAQTPVNSNDVEVIGGALRRGAYQGA